MNVKIVLTVPFEKVPQKVSEILQNVARDMEDNGIAVADIASAVFKCNDILKQIEEIDKRRKQLTLLDSSLEDCYNVLTGFVNYKANPAGVSQRNEEDVRRPTKEG